MKKHQASSTAYTVIQGVLYIAQHPAYSNLVSDDVKNVCLKILSDSKEGRKRLRQLDNWWFKPLIPIIERLMTPGIMLHYVLRKRYIEDYTLQSLHDGGKQVLNLGAGFDTLAYRLAKRHSNVNFVEFDYPATQQVKTHALMTTGDKWKNLHFLPIDFTTQLIEDVLKQSSYVSCETQTLCILEGVLMYLNEIQVKQLFESLSQVFHAGIRVIFTAAEPASKSTYSYGPLLKMYLNLKGEALNWVYEKDKVDGFLYSLGYVLQKLAGSQEFKHRYLGSDYAGILNEGEYIAVADNCWSV